MTSLMALLSGRQKLFVDKMSQMLLRESSSFEKNSDTDDFSDEDIYNERYAN